MARILVAEDEPGIALGLEDTLRLEGYQVEVTNNGACASRRALEEAFDLIVLDVMLPGKNGFDICRDLRRTGFDVPIIFLSARTLEVDRIAGLDLGANDYVTKPFSPRELMARVRGLLRSVDHSRKDRKRWQQEIEAASQVQHRLFPSVRPPIRGLRYAGGCRPASGVSGDYYDFITLPTGSLALLLADVCGKGMPAALLTASLHAAVRTYASAAGGNCGEVLEKINRLLFETTSAERFVTIFYAVYDPNDRTLTWTNAGHCPPMWIRAASAPLRLESLTPPAGILPEIPSLQRTVQLAPDDRLLIFSDGITESCDADGNEFGDERLFRLVQDKPHLPPDRLCEVILDCVRDFNNGYPQADDLTVVAAEALTES